MTRSLPVLLVAFLAAPLPALNLGSEFRVSDPAVEPSILTRWGPRIASNGHGFLAIWYDEIDRSIRGARLDAGGQLIDRTSLIIDSTVPGLTGDVASDGRDYAVAYRCDRAGDAQTCVAHVSSATGAVTRGAAIARATNASIGSNGHGYLVAYHLPDRNDLWAIAVSADALTLGKTLPVTSTGTQWPPAIASDGDDYLIVSNSHTQLYATVVSETKVLREAQPLSTAAPVWGAIAFGWTVGSNGHEFLVVWQQNLGLQGAAYVTELRARPVASDGTLGGETTIPIDRNRAWYPAVAWSGSRYEVAYSVEGSWPQYLGTVPAATQWLALAPSGDLVEGPVVISPAPDEANPAIASDGDVTVVVSEQRTRIDRVEITAVVTSTGASQVVSNSIAWQQSLAGSATGDTALLAWEEIVAPSQRHEVRLQRIDARGLPRDGRGIVVSPSALDQVTPALSPSWIAWLEQPLQFTSDGAAYARNLDSEGLPRGDAIALGAAAHSSTISIASSRTESLVVWQSPESRIVGVRVANDGTVLDTAPFAISAGTADVHPIVKSDGTDFLVVWQKADALPGWFCAIPEGCPPPLSLQSALVSATGTVGYRAQLAPADTATPALVWDGSEFSVFYAGTDPLTWRYAFHAQKIDRDGVPFWGGPQTIEMEAWISDAQWGGREFILTYRAGRDDFIGRLDADFHLVDSAPLGSLLGAVVVVPRSPDLALIAYTVPIDGVCRAVARFAGESVSARRHAARSQ